jgi:dephospho-CoA kinase
MLLLGLTGSIATGKSTVSQILRDKPHSLPIVDADVIARQVVEPGTTGYKAIIARFSASVPDLLLPADDPACEGREDGPAGKGRPLNRPALGRAVFGGGEEQVAARKALNGIVHPAVRRAMWKQVVRPRP